MASSSSSSSSSFQDGVDKSGPRESHISIDVEGGLDPNWVSRFNEGRCVEPQILSLSTSISCSIHGVPQKLRLLNLDAYTPEVISIGPLHYGEREGRLKFMEEHKWRYLDEILRLGGEGSLERCLIAVKEVEERARNCYSEVIGELDSFSFVKMMVLDGCFMIQFFRKNNWDPIFQFGWLVKAIKTDLLMLENQIPFFILQRLSDVLLPTNAAEDVSSPSPALLVEWALKGYGVDPVKGERIKDSNTQIQHLLHLYHTSSTTFDAEKSSGSWHMSDLIPTASRLEEGGIKFRVIGNSYARTSFLNIKFQKGVLQIPSISVWGVKNTALLNCIALEQCYNHCNKKHFTAYALFMDYLINTSKDIDVLSRNGIIKNQLGTDEDLANFFNNMGRELVYLEKDFYLGGVCKKIKRYCRRPWPKLRATLVRDYFKSPWAIISFLGALLLLLLTMTQTFFTALPKYAHENLMDFLYQYDSLIFGSSLLGSPAKTSKQRQKRLNGTGVVPADDPPMSK